MDRIRGDDLPSGLDFAAFDWAVNSGTGRPAKVIQKYISAKQDGAIGPKTLALVAENDPANIIQYLYEQRQKFYERLPHFDRFGKGWTRRNQETLKAAMEMANERKFKKVAKDKKSGLPKKYVKGSSNPDKTRNEIKRTRRLYLMGKLTPAMMDRISEQRSKT